MAARSSAGAKKASSPSPVDLALGQGQLGPLVEALKAGPRGAGLSTSAGLDALTWCVLRHSEQTSGYNVSEVPGVSSERLAVALLRRDYPAQGPWRPRAVARRKDTAPSALPSPVPGSVAHYAAERGQLRILTEIARWDRSLLQAADRDGRTPLHYAARAGQASAMHLLALLGVDLSCTDKSGCTPLSTLVTSPWLTDVHAAASLHHLLLFSCWRSIDVLRGSRTSPASCAPLVAAIVHARVNCVRVLLAAGGPALASQLALATVEHLVKELRPSAKADPSPAASAATSSSASWACSDPVRAVLELVAALEDKAEEEAIALDTYKAGLAARLAQYQRGDNSAHEAAKARRRAAASRLKAAGKPVPSSAAPSHRSGEAVVSDSRSLQDALEPLVTDAMSCKLKAERIRASWAALAAAGDEAVAGAVDTVAGAEGEGAMQYAQCGERSTSAVLGSGLATVGAGVTIASPDRWLEVLAAWEADARFGAARATLPSVESIVGSAEATPGSAGACPDLSIASNILDPTFLRVVASNEAGKVRKLRAAASRAAPAAPLAAAAAAAGPESPSASLGAPAALTTRSLTEGCVDDGDDDDEAARGGRAGASAGAAGAASTPGGAGGASSGDDGDSVCSDSSDLHAFQAEVTRQTVFQAVSSPSLASRNRFHRVPFASDLTLAQCVLEFRSLRSTALRVLPARFFGTLDALPFTTGTLASISRLSDPFSSRPDGRPEVLAVEAGSPCTTPQLRLAALAMIRLVLLRAALRLQEAERHVHLGLAAKGAGGAAASGPADAVGAADPAIREALGDALLGGEVTAEHVDDILKEVMRADAEAAEAGSGGKSKKAAKRARRRLAKAANPDRAQGATAGAEQRDQASRPAPPGDAFVAGADPVTDGAGRTGGARAETATGADIFAAPVAEVATGEAKARHGWMTAGKTRSPAKRPLGASGPAAESAAGSECQTTLHRNQLLVADLQARLHAATIQLHHLSEANAGLNRALMARDDAAGRRVPPQAHRPVAPPLAAAPQASAAPATVPPPAPVESSLAPSSDKSRLRQLQTALHDSDPRAEALGLGVHNMLGLQLRKLSSSQLEALEEMLRTVLGKAQATRALKEAADSKQATESGNAAPAAPKPPSALGSAKRTFGTGAGASWGDLDE
ncbi:hypothetical protein FNF29_00647 [Cafeteria roenbergensis]|uniref:Uncharacterized protein n=1 Tax=Cafeteria roenbergensis TaxID=33653 RepID=A0A5A8CWE0_CAFRO|nr:hypothetical protein FNF29_00647 [Cafeteria roenbergensis]|eukprot:KAA0157295.1 hypothetical protein FNF29_00647 [Cafeteria roenbergensis]